MMSSRFTQQATRLPLGETPDPDNPGGHWENRQDPDSGAIVKVWVEDDPDVPNDLGTEDFACEARAFISSGFTGNGTAERWQDSTYMFTDVLRIKYSRTTVLKLSDRVTNITDASGNIIYLEENGEPTVYNVDGTNPVLDPFGNLIEYTAFLSRAEVQ